MAYLQQHFMWLVKKNTKMGISLQLVCVSQLQKMKRKRDKKRACDADLRKCELINLPIKKCISCPIRYAFC